MLRLPILAAALLAALSPLMAENYLVYIGTNNAQKAEGIYAYRFDAETGKLDGLGVVAEVEAPNFLALHPSGQYLYAASRRRMPDGGLFGRVVAYAIDQASGKLRFLNEADSQGQGPCHLNVDNLGLTLAVANYSSGSSAVLAINPDGSLRESVSHFQHEGSSADPERQTAPHAHSVNYSPDNRILVVADLGIDKLLLYRVDQAAASMQPHEVPYARLAPGAGPRHFTFHPTGRFAYAINELASTITGFTWNEQRGALAEIETVSTLPDDFHGVNSTAEVLAHPSGRFVYGSNRGHDSLAVFAVDQETGQLTARGHVSTMGKTPRNFRLDPSGRWLFAANQASDTVVVFRVDERTGDLTATGDVLDVPVPTCVRFLRVD